MHRLTVTPDVVLRESSIESRLVPAFAAHGSFLSRRLTRLNLGLTLSLPLDLAYRDSTQSL